MKQKVKIKLLKNNSLPKKSYETDACYDVIATSKKEFGDGRIEYGLGFSLDLPENSQIDLRARSSIHKTGLILSNGIGTGDEGYTGEYKVVFYHIIPTLPAYEVGDRVAQIQLKLRNDIEFILVEELSESNRGTNGYGSTGK
jgi:dUTP pyrophosphatase